MVPSLVSGDGSLNSSDSGNLGSDESHLGLGSESLLVEHDSVSGSLSNDLDSELLSGELNGDLPFVVLLSSSGLSTQSCLVGLSGDLDLNVSLSDGLKSGLLSNLSGSEGDLGLLDFAELSGVFSSGFTGGDTSEISVSVGTLLGSDGKTDSGSLLGFGNTSVLDAELELQSGDVSELTFLLESESSLEVQLASSLEGGFSDGLEVSHVSHSGLSDTSLNSSGMESSDNGGTSSELGLVGCDVVSLVLSSSGIDILELSSLGADESGLVEAVSVHPVGSSDNGDTSGTSTLFVVGLSSTPVLVLEGFTVDPSVTRLGLTGTDPVSLDVRLDHVLNLELFLRGENRYKFTTPFAANTSGVVPGLLLLEDFKVSNNLVGDSLEVSSLSSSHTGSFCLDSSGSSLLLGKSSSSSLSGSSFLVTLDLVGSGFLFLGFLDLEGSDSGSFLLFSGLFSSSSSLSSISLLFVCEFLSSEDSFSLLAVLDSDLGSSGSSLGFLFVSSEFLSSFLSFGISLGFSFGSSL